MIDNANAKEYVAALCQMKDGVLRPYESERFAAENNDDAVGKATEWAMANVGVIAEETWLQVTLDGVGVHSRVLETRGFT